MTNDQWTILLTHFFEKKKREKEEYIQLIEYLALLVSINPKGVNKVIQARRKQKEMQENMSEDKEKYLTVNKEGQNEFGQHVNTTFFADLEKYGGAEALKAFENPQDYKIDTGRDESQDDEDDKFIKDAKRAFKEREKELEEEAKFKEEHPELFEADSIIF